MKLIVLLLYCVCGYHGVKDQIDIPFKIVITDDGAIFCRKTQDVVVKEGQTVRLSANIKYSDGIYIAHCKYNNGTGFRELGEQYYKEPTQPDWYLNVTNIKKDKFGDWRCELKFNKDNNHGLQRVEGGYTDVNCSVRVTGENDNETSEPIKDKMDFNTIAIICSVGILVLVIIIAQTIALCYFKRKAQPRRRMDNMTTRSRFDRSDQARYSAPPCRKHSKGNARAQADTDSHIYEMVGVNALYKESKDLNQEVKAGTNERNIKDRPPLPLPHEIADPVPQGALPRPKPSPLKSTLSTMSLLSNSGTLSSKKGKDPPPTPGQGFKKAPARPPKQIDELPGSLQRPPKTLPSPALVPKAGSIPKMPASDPAMLELKNMFKNRNIGNVSDSPAPSPTSTLEKKPPKIHAKPNKKQQKQEEPKAPPKPIGGVNPLVPPGANQIRLILPKIEESLKPPPKTVSTPTQNVKPIPAPLKKPILPKPKSHPTPTPQPTKPHMSQATPKSQPTPTSQPTTMSPPLSRPLPPVTHLASLAAPVPHMSPLQNRPLPIPNEAPTVTPLPPDTIYQTAGEDDSPHTDDDEEWTYEQLGQYNLYNI